MKNYEVEITETLQLTVNVEANSREEAEAKAEEQWLLGEHILDADSFVGVDFKTVPESKNKIYER